MRHQLIIFFNFILFSIFSQNTIKDQSLKIDIPSDWLIYEIGDIGQIAIPSTLELRSKNSIHTLNQIAIKNYSVVHKKIETSLTSNFQIIFQPLGYDNGKISSTYQRVLIQYQKGKKGDFMKWNGASTLTSSDREEIDKKYRQNLLDAISKGKDIMKVKLISRTPIEIGKVNGLSYIKHSYTRQMGERPMVKVQTYTFYNSEEMVEITISYGLEENETTISDLDKIISTFNFTTRK